MGWVGDWNRCAKGRTYKHREFRECFFLSLDNNGDQRCSNSVCELTVSEVIKEGIRQTKFVNLRVDLAGSGAKPTNPSC